MEPNAIAIFQVLVDTVSQTMLPQIIRPNAYYVQPEHLRRTLTEDHMLQQQRSPQDGNA